MTAHANIEVRMVNPEIQREQLRPIRRSEYEQMAAFGMFEDERVELLDGAIVAMAPIGPPHVDIVTVLTKRFILQLGERATVRAQAPLALSDLSMPEPDLALVPHAGYRVAHATTAFLVIEVSQSSLRTDRGVKSWLYATACIPEYWIVDVAAREVEVRNAPRDGEYTKTERFAVDDTLRVRAFPDVEIALRELF